MAVQEEACAQVLETYGEATLHRRTVGQGQ